MVRRHLKSTSLPYRPLPRSISSITRPLHSIAYIYLPVFLHLPIHSSSHSPPLPPPPPFQKSQTPPAPLHCLHFPSSFSPPANPLRFPFTSPSPPLPYFL